MPKKHRKGLVTVTAVDNVDHHTSSATSMFHGTSISVYQINESNLHHKKFIYENKIRFK